MKTTHLTLVFSAVFAASCAPKAQESTQPRETAPEIKTEETTMANFKENKKADATFSLKNPALADAKAPETFKVKFTTTKGDFTLEVTRSWSPLGADRFYNLVKIGYFTDIAFFRVIADFMAQFGIHGDPAVSAAWRGANIADDPVKESNKKGYISYAMAGPGTRTTQMFISYGNNARLDAMGFSPFGRVTGGMEVVESIYSGYGEGAPSGMGPDQSGVQMKGNDYLKKDFPKLDYILSASIE